MHGRLTAIMEGLLFPYVWDAESARRAAKSAEQALKDDQLVAADKNLPP